MKNEEAAQKENDFAKRNTLFDLSDNEELSEITESDEKDLDFENLQSFIVEKKQKIFESEKPYSFLKGAERSDVYIKNYLMKFDMVRTLKILEQEFFEKLSQGVIDMEKISNVPDLYLESENLQERIGNIQKELDDAKIYAEKANSLFLKLNKAKENEKIKHRRVQQEKVKLIKEIEKLKKVYDEDNKIYKDLKKKYWDVTKESLVLEQEMKGLTSKVVNLKEQEDKLKKTLDDTKKHKESNIFFIFIFILDIHLFYYFVLKFD
jgi:hypothetical protein